MKEAPAKYALGIPKSEVRFLALQESSYISPRAEGFPFFIIDSIPV